MASMVKEKRRVKKKAKEKHSRVCSTEAEGELGEASSISVTQHEEDSADVAALENVFENLLIQNISDDPWDISQDRTSSVNKSTKETEASKLPTACSENFTAVTPQKTFNEVDSYKDLNARLQRMVIPVQSSSIDESVMVELENLDAYLQSKQNQILQELYNHPELAMLESVVPSAPMSELMDPEQIQPQAPLEDELVQQVPKAQCMPLDEAIRLYGGIEMTAVKSMSEKEESEVEMGPNCGPEHPLVDLLSTFRSSIRAVEREKSRLASKFDDEEKFRSSLWKIERKKMHLTEQCKCGVSVDMTATYEHAQLLKQKLPAAKMKLEGLLKDVQESYCHHQHAAMLAHCQIEDYIAETIQGNKNSIRDALSLILQSLRVSDGAPEALPAALQRWAEILASVLVDERDLRQLFFVMHHLYRQTRSVSWAARVLTTRVHDSVSAARTLAVLDTLLSKMHLESAVECVEEAGEGWEEVDIRGGGGAVSSGTLRERDLIALVRALPLQQLIAKLVLFHQSDFRQAGEYDWGDASGGNGVLKSCCGVRVLLSILQRAATLHSMYERLHGVLREVACSALTSLDCLYRTPRAPYLKELEDKIILELHAAFAAGFTLFGSRELYLLPATLLTEQAARDYCLTFIVSLHDKSPKIIESLSIEAPVLTCVVRLRIITHAAANRNQDHELAQIVLDFLLQIGLKRKSVPCKAGCESVARECASLLLTAHSYLRGIALHTVADLSQETLDSSAVSILRVNKWRPNLEDMEAVLKDWSQRCPDLLQQLLMQLDYTPNTGVSLIVQLHIGEWLCTWAAGSPARAEGAWRVLLRLRTHRAGWHAPPPAPPPARAPADLLSAAHAVLASDWGHSLPLICSHGVNAILTLCATRPREAVHCLAPVMLLMPQSPESVSLTPKFAELFTILLSCGPNLVQRAFGRGGASGSELLLRLVLSQVDMKQPYVFPAWLHALWKVPAALCILDIAALAVRDWYAMDLYAASLIQEENAKEHLANAVRFAFTSPLLCECLLRAAHTYEVNSQLFPNLVVALSQQRAASQRIHVDNALQKINPNVSSEELTIYRCANAAMVAPFQHPSHLALWRLFFHMYLQRPHNQFSSYPCGPLFFSGIIKSRTLAQIKKRLLETAAHHQSEAELYKDKQLNAPRNRVERSASIVIDNTLQLLPSLSIADLTGESRSDDGSDSEEEIESQNVAVDGSTVEAIEVEKKRNANMVAYHAGAQKMMREFSRWLEDGEKVQAQPQSADIARFILPQALEEAWMNTLSRCRPPPSPDLDTFIRPEETPTYSGTDGTNTPLQVAVASILSVKCRSSVNGRNRSLRRIRPRDDEIDNVIFSDICLLMPRVSALLKDIEKYAQEWDAEVSRISSLDSRLWELVGALRVPRPLPPVRRQCSNNCKPITFDLNTHEWCISAGAERGIRESRSASLAGIRRLTRARPLVAQTAAALHTMARRIRCGDHAVKVLELTWRCAGQLKPCTAAHAALLALFDELAERWITHDVKLCHTLLNKGCEHNSSALQQKLCGSLVAPRRMKDSDWPDIYVPLLNTKLPSPTVFSFLSRFEMSRWALAVEPLQRQTVLKEVLQAAQCFNPQTREEFATESVLIELYGVHIVALTSSEELIWLLLESAKISVAGSLLPLFWKHFNKVAEMHANKLAFDEQVGLLRGFGIIWGSACMDFCERHATYAQVTADVLCILMREFVATAIKLTFEPARVGDSAWISLVSSWSPWVFPVCIMPEPASSGHYVTMVKRYFTCITIVMRDCPGSEVILLQHIFSWLVTARLHSQPPSGPLGARLAVLMEQSQRLPWREHQWFTPPASASFISTIDGVDEELAQWSCERFRSTKAETFLHLLEGDVEIGIHLSNLLKLFTGNLFVNDPELLKEAALLPWWRLTEEDLSEGLNLFFLVRFSLSQPYHEIPHINVILHAGEFQPFTQYSAAARSKRARLVSRWAAVFSSPALLEASPSFTEYILKHIILMDPYLEADETQDLLYRAAIIMTWQQKDSMTTVQSVWSNWICNTAPVHMLPPCMEMSSKLTVLEVTAPFVDNATRMYLLKCEGGWWEVRRKWQAMVLQSWYYAQHCALHAAYAAELTYSQPVHARSLISALLALTEGNHINFIESETIIAVWICYVTRVVLECKATLASIAFEPIGAASSTTSPFGTAPAAAKNITAATTATNAEITKTYLEECKHAALSLLATWGHQQRRSILKVVTLQADTERSTARHRALIRLADCIISPSVVAAQVYESACAAVSGTTIGDVTTWGHNPVADRLPRLAMRLFPTVPERYFQYEMDHYHPSRGLGLYGKQL